MTDDPVYKHFQELSWRRKLTVAEEAELALWLESNPEAQAEWEAEAGLNDAIGLLPEYMVGSNFTARVLQGVELAKAAEFRLAESKKKPWWNRLIPRVALAGLVGGAGIFSWAQFHAAHARAEARKEQAIKGVVTVSNVPTLPSADILEDFETVRLREALFADEKLLTLLQ